MMTPAKSALRDELAALLKAELDAATRSHLASVAAATHEEAKPENDKDTRALEQSYVARGQAMRVRDLELAVSEVAGMPIRAFRERDPIALSALVFADEGGVELKMFIAPHGGGHVVAGVQVVTPKSPLGRALVGKCSGEACEVVVNRRREIEIVRVE
jgi:acetyl esterase/lipase